MLINGNSYSLKELFTKSNRIIIPDMQREYCWAQTKSSINNENLISNFLSDLLGNNKNEDNQVQLGLLYAYESPKNDFQLCDGQQRITTLYLLLGFLYSNTSEIELKSSIKNFLVIDAVENKKNYDIRLQYAIRESTLFFLNDLVNQYFLLEKFKEDTTPSNTIKNSDWYFNEYSLDPSIQNIILALETFQVQKNKFTDEFSNFLLKNITFLYFDMENRTYGEEQFVVLNTTGEPLTKTENLKPLFLGNLDNSIKLQNGKTQLRHYADLWEDWELFFWENKPGKEQTADAGLIEFFRWIFIIEATNSNDILKSEKENYNLAQKALGLNSFDIFELGNNKIKILDSINEYFNVIEKIRLDNTINSNFLFCGELSQIALFELLPLLCFLKEFDETIESQFYIRFKQFLKSRAKDENVSKASITTTIRAIQIAKAMKNANDSDIAAYSNYEATASETILTAIEILKFEILKDNADNRNDIEEAFWQAENYQIFLGNIGFMFEVLNTNVVSDFELNSFEKLSSIILETLEKPDDNLRRALLTFGHYYQYDGYSTNIRAWRYSLGENGSFFNSIIKKEPNEVAPNVLFQFLTKANTTLQSVSRESIKYFYQTCIDEFQTSDTNIWVDTVSNFIKSEEFMTIMQNKRFCITEDESHSYALYRQKVMGSDSFKKII
ncbi:DUF262 domain-containing protein [Flavobacterium sp. RSB2_4_14]|uniref:DUF262 domain-containing protein n=1 Tax=Flavobacterium sp. RSB2_4_14 TaxID=3447665 RepID=UPI003F35937B